MNSVSKQIYERFQNLIIDVYSETILGIDIIDSLRYECNFIIFRIIDNLNPKPSDNVFTYILNCLKDGKSFEDMMSNIDLNDTYCEDDSITSDTNSVCYLNTDMLSYNTEHGDLNMKTVIVGNKSINDEATKYNKYNTIEINGEEVGITFKHWNNATDSIELYNKDKDSYMYAETHEMLYNLDDGNHICENNILCSDEVSLDELEEAIDRINENDYADFCIVKYGSQPQNENMMAEFMDYFKSIGYMKR